MSKTGGLRVGGTFEANGTKDKWTSITITPGGFRSEATKAKNKSAKKRRKK